jgi:hypothetical protein
MPLPTAKFPGAIASAADLLEHSNVTPSQAGSPPTLLAGITAAANSIALNPGSGAQLPLDNFVVSIDDEIIFVGTRSGDTLSTCTRAYEGTAANTHSANAAVLGNITALSHNQMASEIIALETNATNFKGNTNNNLVWAGPGAAPASPAAFRALVNADLPSVIANSRTTVSITATGQVVPVNIASGGSQTVWLLSVATNISASAGAYSATQGAWLLGSLVGYPETVTPTFVTLLGSWNNDNSATVRVAVAGAINGVVNITVTVTGTGPVYPFNLIYSLTRLL